MNGELALYTAHLKHLLDRVYTAVEGLDQGQLNWRPPASNANSVYVVAAHILGNVEAWVLGIACGQPVERDRPAEFRAAGPDAAPLQAHARDLAQRIEEALAALPPEALDEAREPSASLWGEGTPRRVTARAALMNTTEHAATHLGEIEVRREWALADGQS